jgi:adenine-specific DNA methylase
MIQPALFGEEFAEAGAFRPIHYLGSKLRLIPAIEHRLSQLGTVGPVCDLFAGSGTVTAAISKTRPTIAVDIQEYARVICSALTDCDVDRAAVGRSVVNAAKQSQTSKLLAHALAPVVAYEEKCIELATCGNVEPLCEFLECGALLLAPTLPQHGPLYSAVSATVDRLQECGLQCAPESLVSRHFAGPYFSYRQAAALDSLLAAAHGTTPESRDVALAPVLSAASEIVNTVGKHFAQPIRPRGRSGEPKPGLLRRVQKDRRLDVFDTYEDFVERFAATVPCRTAHISVRDDFDSFLSTYSGRIAVFYADPPYTRDHYSRFYHALETMALRDEPTVSTTLIRSGAAPRLSRGFYRSDRHQSPFCIKSQAPGAFRRLFTGVSGFGAPLILSYSPFEDGNGQRPRVMGVEEIVDLARGHFVSVDVISAGGFTHSKLNAHAVNVRANRDAEVIIMCVP